MTVAFNAETGEAVRLDESGQWVKTQTAKNPQTGETLAYDGQGWSKIDTSPKRSTLESVGNYIDGTVRSIANGLTFGLADEFAAGASSTTGIGEQAGPGSTYEQNLAAERGRDRGFGDEYPITSTVAEMGGAIAGTVAPMGLAVRTLGTGAKAGPLVSKLMTPAKTMAGKMAQGTAAGATAGGIYGFNTGEGGFGPRMENATVGAAIGGAAGGAAPPIISGLGKFGQTVASWAGGRSAAERKVLENVMRDFPGMDEQQAIAAAESRLRQLGPQGALMDVGGNTRGLARSAYTIPGGGKTKIDDFLTARQEGTRGVNNVLEGGQINRITSALDDVTPSRLRGSMDDLTTRRQANAGPLYEQAYSKQGVYTDRLKEFLDDPTARMGLKQGVEIQRLEALAQGKPFNPRDAAITGFNEAGDPIIGEVPNMRTWDAIKRGLDGMIEAETNNVTGKMTTRGRALVQVKNAFTNEIDTMNPAYAEARAAYSGPSQLMDAAKKGSEFMRGGVGSGGDDLAAQVAKMSDDERHYMRIGAVQAIRDRLDGMVTRADASKKVMDIPGLENKIRIVFGDDQTYSRYIDMLKSERTMFESYGAIKGGSRTGEVLAEQADTGIDKGRIAEGMMDVLSPTSGSMSRVRGVGDIMSGLKDRATISPKMSSQLGDILTGRQTDVLQRRMIQEQMDEAMRNRLTRRLLGLGVAGSGQAN